MEAATEIIKLSFTSGENQIPKGRVQEFRNEIMTSFGVTSHQAYFARRRGEYGFTPLQIKATEEIFAKYGVTEKIWDNPVKRNKSDTIKS